MDGAAGSRTASMAPRRVSRASQFAAVLRKNFLLQLRGRRRWFGLGGWPGLLAEVLVPVLFFLVMCIPKHYVKPMPSPLQLSPVYDIDAQAWGLLYQGPASEGSPPRILFSPNTSTAVQRLAGLLAKAAACPADSTKKRNTSDSFYRYFAVPGAPAACGDPSYCQEHEECYQPLLGSRLVGYPTAEAAEAEALGNPETVDAVIEFGGPALGLGLGLEPEEQWRRLAAADVGALPLPPQQQLAGLQAGQWRAPGAGPHANVQGGGSSGSSGAGSSLSKGGSGQHGYAYSLRLNHTSVPFTRLLFNRFDVAPGKQYRSYWWFLNLQALLDQAILSLAAADRAPGVREGASPPLLPLRPSVKPFPWPAVTLDLGATAAALFFNLLLVSAFLSPTRSAVASVVQEKELTLREGMRILGLQDGAYWASWAITHWSTMAVSGVLCAIVGLYPFEHSSPLLMLALYWVTALALLAFAYCLTTLFSKARVAGTAAALVYLAAMVPGYVMPSLQPYGGAGWVASCLLPPSALSLFTTVLVKHESVQQGLTWQTINEPVTVEYQFSAATVYCMLLVDVALYSLLLWYLDKVMPSDVGQNLPFYFPLTPSYWGLSSGGSKASAGSGGGHGDGSNAAAGSEGVGYGDRAVDGAASSRPLLGQQRGAVLPAPPQGGSGVAVRIVGLTKVFPTTDGGAKVAVDGLTLDVAAGAITALLGHNGAGKTTTISILTGLLKPTSGDAYIAGHSVRRDMSSIRHSLGVCPQFDVLWPSITVREHLELFAAIKGFQKADRAGIARAAAAEVGLHEKLDSPAGDLSGGQRRKLSVALAFVGDPAVVILDEPTSGMDPYSRRFTWDVIRRRRRGSSIVLTTHSMEEADLLADRIAIMAEGRLAAEGNSLDLKARFGVGYTLTIVRSQSVASGLHSLGRTASNGSPLAAAEGAPLAPGVAAAAPAVPAVEAGGGGSGGGGGGQGGSPRAAGGLGTTPVLAALVREHVPGVRLLTDGGEVAFRLPRECSARLPALLRALEARSGELGVRSYGMSVTTLEEVFLRVSEAALLAREEGEGAAAGVHKAGPATGGGGALSPPASHQRAGADGTGASTSAGAGAGEGDDVAEALASLEMAEGLPAGALLHTPHLKGAALWRQQFRALFTKRLLCAKRDRMAALVQVAVPILLVLVALWVRQLSAAYPQQPALALDRDGPLAGKRAALAASPALRGNGSAALAGFVESYPEGSVLDSGATRVLRLPYFEPMNDTIDQYLLQSWYRPERHYDALYLDSLPDLVANASAGASEPIKYTLLVNQTAIHGLPAAANQASSALLRWLTGDPEAGITAINHPLPVIHGEQDMRVNEQSGSLLLVLCLVMAGAVLSSSFAVYLVRERESRSKAVQAIAGTAPSAFWGATLAWDLIHFSVPAAGMVSLFSIFDLPQFRGARLAATALLLWAFSLAALPLTYLLQFGFTDEMKALQRLNSLFFMTGYLGFLSTWIMDMIVMFLHTGSVERVNRILKRLLQLASPHYCLGRSIYQVSQCYKADEGLPNVNPFTYDTTGAFLLSFAGQAAVYVALTLLVEVGVIPRLAKRAQRAWQAARAARGTGVGAGYQPLDSSAQQGEPREDEDVEEEREAIQSGRVTPASSVVLLDGVKKTYWQESGPVRAVRGLWAAVPGGECFGLLGVNGAGKTTTFSMLTGEVMPDDGAAYVAGHSLLMQPALARRHMGYCPQFSALPGQMTGREVLRMYARLRGLPEGSVEAVARQLLSHLGLVQYADRACGTYSGGNKRKLSVAVSLVGGCPAVLMDEPSTGMDPGARRALWGVIDGEVQRAGRTLVLTSHSMEECEAVCSRVGIMAAGTLRCLGTVQHLKSRFGEGYLLEVRTAPGRAPAATEVVRRQCPAAALREQDGVHLAFAIPRQGLDLPALFEAIEGGKEAAGIEEYSLSQTTLEQVFIHMARDASHAEDGGISSDGAQHA